MVCYVLRGGVWRSGNSPVTNTGMDPAGDENVGSSPVWHVAPFLRANCQGLFQIKKIQGLHCTLTLNNGNYNGGMNARQ